MRIYVWFQGEICGDSDLRMYVRIDMRIYAHVRIYAYMRIHVHIDTHIILKMSTKTFTKTQSWAAGEGLCDAVPYKPYGVQS